MQTKRKRYTNKQIFGIKHTTKHKINKHISPALNTQSIESAYTNARIFPPFDKEVVWENQDGDRSTVCLRGTWAHIELLNSQAKPTCTQKQEFGARKTYYPLEGMGERERGERREGRGERKRGR